MNDPTRPTASSPRPDGLTALALAAGLAFGHIVQAMAERDAVGAQTMLVALFFVVAASLATVFALLAVAAQGSAAPAQKRVTGWIVAIGAGLVGSIAPALL